MPMVGRTSELVKEVLAGIHGAKLPHSKPLSFAFVKQLAVHITGSADGGAGQAEADPRMSPRCELLAECVNIVRARRPQIRGLPDVLTVLRKSAGDCRAGALGRRLRRLSRVRNWEAHPDLSLAADLEQYMADQSDSSQGDRGEEEGGTMVEVQDGLQLDGDVIGAEGVSLQGPTADDGEPCEGKVPLAATRPGGDSDAELIAGLQADNEAMRVKLLEFEGLVSLWLGELKVRTTASAEVVDDEVTAQLVIPEVVTPAGAEAQDVATGEQSEENGQGMVPEPEVPSGPHVQVGAEEAAEAVGSPARSPPRWADCDADDGSSGEDDESGEDYDVEADVAAGQKAIAAGGARELDDESWAFWMKTAQQVVAEADRAQQLHAAGASKEETARHVQGLLRKMGSFQAEFGNFAAATHAAGSADTFVRADSVQTEPNGVFEAVGSRRRRPRRRQ